MAPVLFGLILVLNWVGLGWDGFGLGDLDTRDCGPGLDKNEIGNVINRKAAVLN